MNGDELKERIDSSGLTKSEIANKLGISRQGLYSKLNGSREFKCSEIRKLSELLGFSATDVDNIFFAELVGKSVNLSNNQNPERSYYDRSNQNQL